MTSTPSLVVLAAGLGSRYGSLKQIDKFGPCGETIVDYAIYDAIAVGFKKIVFVMKKETEGEFKEIFFTKLSQKAEITYVFQDLDQLPAGYLLPEGREKPWGTAHAMMSAESKIEEPFAVVNADDFYGRKSLKIIYDFLTELDNSKLSACVVGFILKNTLSEHGRVSRGICETDTDGLLTKIVERTHVFKGVSTPYFEENGRKTSLTGGEVVSMNLIGFTPKIFPLMKEKFKAFLDENMSTKDLKAEYFIPLALDHVMQSGVEVCVLSTDEQWFGVTYKEDKSMARQRLNELVQKGDYPENLWG